MRSLRIAYWLTLLAGAVIGAVLATWLLPRVSWPMAGAGWGFAVGNSLLARAINNRAIGSSRGRFIGWGIVIHSLRMLTTIGIFAYILISWREEAGSFFIPLFSVFFLLMVFEVARLLNKQAGRGSSIERAEPDKCDVVR